MEFWSVAFAWRTANSSKRLLKETAKVDGAYDLRATTTTGTGEQKIRRRKET